MSEDQVTLHLQAFRDGDASALDRIVPLLYHDLKRMAGGQLRRGAPAMPSRPPLRACRASG